MGTCRVGKKKSDPSRKIDAHLICPITLRGIACQYCDYAGSSDDGIICSYEWYVCKNCYPSKCPVDGPASVNEELDWDAMLLSSKTKELLKETDDVYSPDIEEHHPEEIWVPALYFQCPHCGEERFWIEAGWCNYNRVYDDDDRKEINTSDHEGNDAVCGSCGESVLIEHSPSQGDIARFVDQMTKLSIKEKWALRSDLQEFMDEKKDDKRD